MLLAAATAVVTIGANDCEGEPTSEEPGLVAPADTTPCDDSVAAAVSDATTAFATSDSSTTDVEIRDCRRSETDESWAAVTVEGLEGGPLVAVLHTVSAPEGDDVPQAWELIAFGSDGAGCVTVPGAVQAELGLACPVP